MFLTLVCLIDAGVQRLLIWLRVILYALGQSNDYLSGSILDCNHKLLKRITTWWRHQMETVSALLAICAGNSSVTGEFPTQRPVTRSFDVFLMLICDWINVWVNNRGAGVLRRHRAHYDVIVIKWILLMHVFWMLYSYCFISVVSTVFIIVGILLLLIIIIGIILIIIFVSIVFITMSLLLSISLFLWSP